MTLKELLCTISFEEIEPHITLLYPVWLHLEYLSCSALIISCHADSFHR